MSKKSILTETLEELYEQLEEIHTERDDILRDLDEAERQLLNAKDLVNETQEALDSIECMFTLVETDIADTEEELEDA